MTRCDDLAELQLITLDASVTLRLHGFNSDIGEFKRRRRRIGYRLVGVGNDETKVP